MPTNLFAAIAIVAAAQAPAANADLTAIVAAMNASAAGWNAGDVVRFMGVYSDSPAASFVTSRGILRGKAAMLENYRKHYDFADPAKRGRLSFETVDYRPLGRGNALYIARYTLTYPDGKTTSGLTSLVFAREPGGWKIIADHSS
ncbi:YybH family protein [Sphingomonas sp. RS2018]